MIRKIALVFFLFFYCVTIIAKTPSKDLSQMLVSINNCLNLIVKYMGGSPNTKQLYEVRSVTPDSLYFQAKRLNMKVDSLYFEVIGDEAPQDVALQSALDEKKSLETILNVISNNLLNVSAYLNLKPYGQIKKQADFSDEEIFSQLILDNQLVNQLLEKKTQPGDVYKNVTLGVYYTHEILNAMPGAKVIVEPQKFEPNKKPADVYNQLIIAYQYLEKISKYLGVKITDLSRNETLSDEQIVPNDVEELSQIINSALVVILKSQGADVSDIKSYHPGKKYPANVYQRSALLVKNLEEILVYLKKHPAWKKGI